MRLDNETRQSLMLPLHRDTDPAARQTPEERAAQMAQAGRTFEGFMLGELLKTMRNAEGQDRGLFPASRAERIFINQQCEALGNALGEREPLGLARMLCRQIPGSSTADTAESETVRCEGGSHAQDTH